MNNHRKISITAGALYLLTFVSIPTLTLYTQAKSGDYIVSSGSDSAAMLGVLLEVVIAVAGISTAVVLYPILKRQSQTLALGLVAARIVESCAILLGAAMILTIIQLHQGTVHAASLPVSQALANLYDKIFLLSQSFVPAICDLLLGYMFFKSRLVPRTLAVVGMLGAPLLIASYLAVLFGVIEQHSALAGLSAIGVALFEFSLGLWLLIKGFNKKAIAKLMEVKS